MTVRVYRSTDVGAPSYTNAQGSIAAIMKACLVTGYGALAGAGWSNPFSATGIEVFRQGAGNMLYFRIDDSAAVLTSITTARIVGYETMSDVNTGVNAFPTAAQFAFGVHIFRAPASNAVAKQWTLVATEKTVYFFPQASPGSINLYNQFIHFGDFSSYTAGDAWNTLVGANYDATLANTNATYVCSTSGAAASGLYLARKFNQGAGAQAAGRNTAINGISGNFLSNGGLNYPNGADGSLIVLPIYITEPPTNSVRGQLAGCYASAHFAAQFNTFDTASGTGDFAGKEFMFMGYTAGSTPDRGVFVEISDTW